MSTTERERKKELLKNTDRINWIRESLQFQLVQIYNHLGMTLWTLVDNRHVVQDLLL